MKLSELILIVILASVSTSLKAQATKTPPIERLIDTAKVNSLNKQIEALDLEIQSLEQQLKKIELELKILEEKPVPPTSKSPVKKEEEN